MDPTGGVSDGPGSPRAQGDRRPADGPDGGAAQSVSFAAAEQQVHAAIAPLQQVETVALRQALGRVSAAPVLSRVQVPNHTNSALDGYALKAADLTAPPQALRLCGTAMAGRPYPGEVPAGQCVRIMTGAVMPAGCDTVVAQERVRLDGDWVRLEGRHTAGGNVRAAGEDLKIGETAIAAHTRLGAAQLGLAASLGVVELRVFRRPRVAFFSNGDELCPLGSTPALGELYDSNRYTLHAMLSELGVERVDMGIVRDRAEAVRDTLAQAARCADMVVASAGASVGEADYIGQVLRALGEVYFCKVAIKPGRPLTFGRIEQTPFFGLPGNPVSVMVTFQVFVQPAIRRLSGEQVGPPLKLSARTCSRLRKRTGRMEYQRGWLTVDDNGEATVASTGEQGSGILRSMAQANCYIILPTDSAGVEAGERVLVQPFRL